MSTKKSFLVVALLTVGGGLWSYHQHAVLQGSAQQPKAGGNEQLAKLGKVRLAAAERAYRSWMKNEGRRQDGLIYELSVRWLHAQLDLCRNNEERLVAFGAHLERMKDWGKEWETTRADRPDHPYLTIIDSAQAEADYWLAKERMLKN